MAESDIITGVYDPMNDRCLRYLLLRCNIEGRSSHEATKAAMQLRRFLGKGAAIDECFIKCEKVGQFKITLRFHTKLAQANIVYRQLLCMLGDGWMLQDKWAVWTPRGHHKFAIPEVTWAYLELDPT